jgi:hypothetical protein
MDDSMQRESSDSSEGSPYSLFDLLRVGWINLVMVLMKHLEVLARLDQSTRVPLFLELCAQVLTNPLVVQKNEPMSK